MISDGADNASRHSLAQVLDMTARSNTIIYTVGLFAPEDQDARAAKRSFPRKSAMS